MATIKFSQLGSAVSFQRKVFSKYIDFRPYVNSTEKSLFITRHSFALHCNRRHGLGMRVGTTSSLRYERDSRKQHERPNRNTFGSSTRLLQIKSRKSWKMCEVESARVAAAVWAPEGWCLWALLAACAAGGQLLERRSAIGKYVSAPLLTMVAAMVLSANHVIPLTCACYDLVWSQVLPLGASLFLLECDLSRLGSSGGPSLLAFILGSLGSVAGTFIAMYSVGSFLGAEGWKLAAALCASYIGGSVNFAAVASMVSLSGPVMVMTAAADNLAMAIYLAVLSVIPVADAANTLNRDEEDDTSALFNDYAMRWEYSTELVANEDQMSDPSAPESLAVSLAAATFSVAVSSWMANQIGLPSVTLMLVALLSSGLGTVLSTVTRKSAGAVNFKGSSSLGAVLMLFFFATIGAGAADIGSLLSNGWVFVFICIQIAVHMVIVFWLGGQLEIPTETIITASNANVGGPATAAAMAASRGWKHMVTPAMVTGSLGYAVGTSIGAAVGFFLR